MKHGGEVATALVAAAALAAIAVEPVEFVNPFIGTASNGHCTPAACVPFGLVQAAPDTGNGSWRYCSGYHCDDRSILGFSQTHISGTGVPDLGDLRIMPFTGEGGKDDFRCSFKKETEKAVPGYYAVTLEDYGVSVEVSATHHAAIYRINYPKGVARLLVDCQFGIGGDPAGQILSSEFALEGKNGFRGRTRRRCWVEREYSFAAEFDVPFSSVRELPKRDPREKGVRRVFEFDLKPGATLIVKVALSAEGGPDAARRNLAAEIPGWDFDEVRRSAAAKWNEMLSRVAVEGDDAQKTSFYTSLWHLFIQPNDLSDVGSVRPFYSTLSCWDTFRAAHPLYTIIAPEKVPGMVDSMLEQGRRTGFLPVWTLWGKDNQCMIGTHSVPVIVDWFLKEEERGKRDEYWRAAYAQVKDSLTKTHKNRRKEHWDLLDKYGYYPFDEIKGESVSRTLECAYDDWCAARFAAELGMKEDAAFFMKRSSNWRNVFDPSIGMVRGKDSAGRWREPFNPFALGHGASTANDFTEGNAFQYTWHVMQDPEGLISAMGGKEAFAKRLESLFVQPEKTEGSGFVSDVTGLIGQYAHGNEPSHHVIYFFPFVGRSDRAADLVREVFDRFYMPRPDGLCGNDDCGQMSAWYVFSALGFYPFNPCGGEYVLGAPQIPSAVVRLPGGREFRVVARGYSRNRKHVKSVMLNGRPLSGFILKHADVMRGGELVFEMTE